MFNTFLYQKCMFNANAFSYLKSMFNALSRFYSSFSRKSCSYYFNLLQSTRKGHYTYISLCDD